MSSAERKPGVSKEDVMNPEVMKGLVSSRRVPQISSVITEGQKIERSFYAIIPPSALREDTTFDSRTGAFYEDDNYIGVGDMIQLEPSEVVVVIALIAGSKADVIHDLYSS